VTQHLFASEEDYETSHTNTREKHEIRAQAVNSSALGVRVFLWEDAEVISKQLIDAILGIVHTGMCTHALEFVFYVGEIFGGYNQISRIFRLVVNIATKYVNKLVVREALASIMPPDKEQQTLTPVITGNDGKVLNVKQVLDELHFEVVLLYSSN
jgi:hypothetical protein